MISSSSAAAPWAVPVARELSRSQRSVALVEKEADVAAGTSGRNSAVVHAGFNNRPGSLMAQLCVEGNQGFAALCRQLEVPYRKTGKLLVAFDQEDLAVLRRLLAQGEANGCRGLHLLDQAQLGAFLPQVGGIGAMSLRRRGFSTPFSIRWPWRRTRWPTGSISFSGTR